jgi:hypothetical protein
MPKGRWLPEHASCVRCLVVVLLLPMALWRSEPEMGRRGTAAYPLNKLKVASDLAMVTSGPLLLSHQGGEAGVGIGFVACALDLGAVQAAISWCSSSVALQRHLAALLLTFLAERRPCGDPALAQVRRRPSYSSRQARQKGGSSSSSVASHGGVVPSGLVPGGDVAGRAWKLLVGDSRRWWWTRLLFSYLVQGPFCELQERGCIFYFLDSSCVRCKPPLNINAAV